MAVISTGLTEKGLRSEFFNRFDAVPTHFGDWSTRVASTSDKETHKWLGSVPQVREWGNGRVAKGLRTESYIVQNLKYEATLEVDRDELSDDQTGQIRIRVNELAQRAATHKDRLVADLLVNGATSGYVSYDGVTFFNASHSSGNSGTQTNLSPASATTPAAPTTAEFKTAFENAVETMLVLKDDQGEPMNVDTGGLVVVVPPNMLFAATEALNATIISNTSNILAASAMVVSFPYLNVISGFSSAKWYLLKTSGFIRPFIFQDREPIEFASLAEGSEEEFRREKYLYGVRARYRMIYGAWQHAVQVTFS